MILTNSNLFACHSISTSKPPFAFNPFTNRLDVTASNFRGILSSAPSGNPKEGWMYLNSGDDTLYIYYGSTWRALHVLPPSDDLYVHTTGDTMTGELILNPTGDTALTVKKDVYLKAGQKFYLDA